MTAIQDYARYYQPEDYADYLSRTYGADVAQRYRSLDKKGGGVNSPPKKPFYSPMNEEIKGKILDFLRTQEEPVVFNTINRGLGFNHYPYHKIDYALKALWREGLINCKRFSDKRQNGWSIAK